MSYRFMRVVLFFDLPTESLEDKREYRLFRKHLIKSGFIMMQESVYSKLALNQSAVDSILKNLKDNKPKKGMVQVIVITEKQFERMEYLVGDRGTTIIDSDDRLVIL